MECRNSIINKKIAVIAEKIFAAKRKILWLKNVEKV